MILSPDQNQIKTLVTGTEKNQRSVIGKFGRLLADRWPEYILEIIVVIIGITISFTIDNIKNDASDRSLEQMYLARLKADISSDVDGLQAVILRTESILESGRVLLEQSRADEPTLSGEELARHTEIIVARPNYISKNATFSALKSSGYFHLIQDNQLKELLFEYDQQYQGMKAVDMAELHITSTIAGPYFLKNIPWDHQKNNARHATQIKVKNIVNDFEFVNNLILRVGNRTELLENYTQTPAVVTKIKEILEKKTTSPQRF